MEPFSLVCPACQGRLTVKNQNLLGRTLPCPRCQNPLHVQPPKITLSPTSHQAADSHAITKVADDDWISDLDQALEEHRKQVEEQGNASVDVSLAPSQLSEADEEGYSLVPLESAPAPSFETLPMEPLSTDRFDSRPQWEASSSSRSRQILLISVLGASGLLFAGGLFYAFIQYAGKGKSTVAKQEPDNKGVSNDPEKKPDPNDKQSINDDKPAENDRNNQEPESGSNPPVSPTNDGNNSSISTPTDPISPPTKEPNPSTNPNGENPNGAVAEPPMKEKDPPSNGDPNTAEGEIKLPDIFNRFPSGDRLMEDNPMTIPSAGNDNPIADAKEESEIVSVRRLFHPPPLAPVDTEKSLDEKIVKLTYRDRSLLDAAHLLSFLHGVGIEIDLESMMALGLSAEMTITIDSENSTLGKTLEEVLGPLGLEVVARDNGTLLITASEAALEKKVPATWEMNLGNDPSVWVKLLGNLLPDEAPLWRLEGNEILWQPTAKPIHKLRLAIVMDRIRTAIGIPTTSHFLNKDLAVGFEYSRVESCLEKKGESIVYERRPLLQIFAQAARDSELQVLFHWSGLRQHGLGPKTMDLSLLKYRTLQQVVSAHLNRYDLDLVAIDGNTLMLTIPETRRMMSQIRVVKMNEGDSVESIRMKLKSASPTDTTGRNRLMVYEVPGHPFAIVRVCPPLVTQLHDFEASN